MGAFFVDYCDLRFLNYLAGIFKNKPNLRVILLVLIKIPFIQIYYRLEF